MKEELVKTLIHCHSENSRYDSAMSVKTLCQRAKEVGYGAVTLTDHGTLTGIDDFVSAAKEVGIKPIPGVEAYVQEDDLMYKRLHLILLAKDDLGYQGISKAVTDSNRRIDSNGFPRMNKEILMKHFGPKGAYHGHVIATSACVGGVLAGILLSPLESIKAINKLKERQKKYESPDSKAYEKSKERLTQYEAEIEDLVKKREECTVLSKKPYKKKDKDLEKLKLTATEEEYLTAFKVLEEEKKETELAKTLLEEIRTKISLKKKQATAEKGKIKNSEESHAKYLALQKEISDLEEKMSPIEECYDKTIKEALSYDSIFGHGNFYIEIQHHGYLTDDGDADIEKMAMPYLIKIADELSIPIVAGNDAHIPDGSEKSIRARQIICSLRFANEGFISNVQQGDDQIYIKSEKEMKEALLNVTNEKKVNEAITNAYKIGDVCNCTFKSGTHYPKYKGLLPGETSDQALRRMSVEAIKTRFPNKEDWTEEYETRLNYELSVIADMGYSDYFLIVQDFLEFGRKLGRLSNESLDFLKENIKSMSLDELKNYVNENMTEIGFTVGAGRGSAAGSLVAYMVNITNIIDPLKYDLLFERFLTKDRVTMPDVDSDFSPDIRELVVEYCKKLYGISSVANIVTKGYIQPKGAIRNAARVIGIEQGKREYYQALADRIAKKIPSKVGTSFATCEDELRLDFKNDEDANEVINQAKLIEGVFLNYGMHAAGVIIADGQPIENYVPLMRDDKSGDMKVQCDMVQAEEIHGLLKFDFLGLRNLKIATMTVRSIKARTGIELDVQNLPFDPKVFKGIFASGKTGSIFQFESSGMRSMLKEANPTCLEDLIALVSLYRPGPMDFIPKYIEQKAHPDRIKYLCPELESILSKTYGVIVYQEQVMEIVQKLAGYSLSQADNVRRFMSKKKMDKLEHERKDFIYGNSERNIDGCVNRGISKNVATEIFDQMIDFAKYAFNKSHAAVYAVLSYITAYLKYYYPADYMCSVLECNEKIEKMPSLINDCREMGVTVLPPDINKSQHGFSLSGENILFGFDSVKGTKSGSSMAILKDREKNGEYVSFKDFIKRDVADKSTAESLIKAGALDEFNDNRYAMLKACETGRELVSKIKDKKKDIDNMELKYDELKDKKRFITSYQKAKDTLEMLETQFDILRIASSPEDKKQRMLEEKEVLGVFVTASPLDEYRIPEDLGCIPINSLKETREKVTVMGIIQNLEIKRRKSDNKAMAFFDLEDKSGIIHVCCFTKAFAKFSEILEEDLVIKITGFVNVNIDELSGDAEIQIFMDKAKILAPDLEGISIFIPSMLDWNKTLKLITTKGYITKDGHPLLVNDMVNGEFRNTKYYVSEKILEDKEFIAKI